MAGKRSATSELNHENWDREEEAEEAGQFAQASKEALKGRVIKKAKRRGGVGGGAEVNHSIAQSIRNQAPN